MYAFLYGIYVSRNSFRRVVILRDTAEGGGRGGTYFEMGLLLRLTTCRFLQNLMFSGMSSMSENQPKTPRICIGNSTP